MSMFGDYLNPSQESDADIIRKSESFKIIGDTNGWFAVINNKGEYIDAGGRATFTENDAQWVADALNFYMRSKLLDGNYNIR